MVLSWLWWPRLIILASWSLREEEYGSGQRRFHNEILKKKKGEENYEVMKWLSREKCLWESLKL